MEMEDLLRSAQSEYSKKCGELSELMRNFRETKDELENKNNNYRDLEFKYGDLKKRWNNLTSVMNEVAELRKREQNIKK